VVFLLIKKIDLPKLVNDPFQGKGGYMPDKIKEKVDVRIGLNENLAFPEEVIRKLMRQVAETIDPRVYPEDYSDTLCTVLAEKHHLEPSQIVVANGGDKIIDLMVRLTIYAGDSAVLIQPTYPMYEHAIKVQGGKVTESFLTPAPEFDLDPEAVKAKVNPRDRLLFLCSPNNPTGNQFSRDKLVELITTFPGIVALDETYTDFASYSMVPLLNDYPNLIIMKSMSKFYGMAGMRIGYAMGDPFLIKRLKELLPAFNVNVASLELARLVLQEKEVLTKMVAEIIAERERVFSKLKTITGIQPFSSQTNFILFKVLNVEATLVQQKLLKEKAVLVRNMSAMPLCNNCLRMSITTRENNDAFLEALQEVLDSL